MSPTHQVDGDNSNIRVDSGVSLFTGDGYVSLKWGEQAGQLTIAEARAHALSILGAAEAADTDSALWRYLKEGGASDEQAGGMLGAIRRNRVP